MLDLRDVESVAAKGMSVRAATVLALVAELRAARQVIQAFLDDDKTDEASLRIDLALDAYEELTEEPTP